MPNHMHAIVELNSTGELDKRGNDSGVDTHGRAYLHSGVDTHGRAYLQNKPKFESRIISGNRSTSKGNLHRSPKSISSFVAGYKSAVLNKVDDRIDQTELSIAKFNRANPFWQRNFHDHIIRDEKSYHKIRSYIINNPKNWEEDSAHPNNLGLDETND